MNAAPLPTEMDLPGDLPMMLKSHGAKESSKYACASALVHRRNGRLEIAATDGHRLALYEHDRHEDYVNVDDLGRRVMRAGPDFRFGIPLAALAAVKVGASEAFMHLEADDGLAPGNTATIRTRKGSVDFELESADRWPAYNDVVPRIETRDPAKYPGRQTIQVDPALLADAANLMKAFRKRHHGDPVALRTLDGKPYIEMVAQVDAKLGTRMRVVLMGAG